MSPKTEIKEAKRGLEGADSETPCWRGDTELTPAAHRHLSCSSPAAAREGCEKEMKEMKFPNSTEGRRLPRCPHTCSQQLSISRLPPPPSGLLPVALPSCRGCPQPFWGEI